MKVIKIGKTEIEVDVEKIEEFIRKNKTVLKYALEQGYYGDIAQAVVSNIRETIKIKVKGG